MKTVAGSVVQLSPRSVPEFNNICPLQFEARPCRIDLVTVEYPIKGGTRSFVYVNAIEIERTDQLKSMCLAVSDP